MAPQSRHAVVLRHEEALAHNEGREATASVLPQVAVLLVARGADRVIVPSPDAEELEKVMTGVDSLPNERRDLVRVVDTRGELLTRVIDYLSPVSRQAAKWPEDAFAKFSVEFLYELVLGLKYGGSVLSNSVSIVRGFVPIIDPTQFSGEARFRLAELGRLICSYEPALIEQGFYESDAPSASTTNALRIMETAEFNSLVSEAGQIGYLKNPLPALRELRRRFVELIKSPLAKETLTLASTAADASVAGTGSAAKEIFGLALKDRGNFNPAFVSLGKARLSLYRAVLREGLPGASPPPGAIMTFRNQFGLSWLNEGEESNLEEEARARLQDRVRRHREALASLDGLAG